MSNQGKKRLSRAITLSAVLLTATARADQTRKILITVQGDLDCINPLAAKKFVMIVLKSDEKPRHPGQQQSTSSPMSTATPSLTWELDLREKEAAIDSEGTAASLRLGKARTHCSKSERVNVKGEPVALFTF